VAAEYKSLTAQSYFETSTPSAASSENSTPETKGLVDHMVENFVFVMQIQYAACYPRVGKEDLMVTLTGWEPITKTQIEQLKLLDVRENFE